MSVVLQRLMRVVLQRLLPVVLQRLASVVLRDHGLMSRRCIAPHLP